MTSNVAQVVGQEEPIKILSEDKLGRAQVANLLLSHLANTSSSYNEVIAVRGAWGSGKSSILNLTEDLNENSKVKILRFNPWYFHSVENIITQYFNSLGSFIEKNESQKKSVGDKLKNYGRKLARANTSGIEVLIGAKAAWVTNRIQAFARKDESLETIKSDLERDISNLDYKIAIFIDDLDRLDKDEILLVFKLIKLLADFRNVSYVAAVDFAQVTSMLNLQQNEGTKYLEKIFSSIIDVPELTQETLSIFTTNQLQKVIDASVLSYPIDRKHWQLVYSDVIKPLIKTPRDVRRICQNLFYSFNHENLSINPVDLIALETIRVLTPKTYLEIFRCSTSLTTPHNYGQSYQNQKSNPLVETHKANPEWADSLISCLFPFAKHLISNTTYPPEFNATWLQERKVANQIILNHYFTKTEDKALTNQLIAEQLLEAKNSESVVSTLEPLDSRSIEAVLELLHPLVKAGGLNNPLALLSGVFSTYPKLKKRAPERLLDLGAYLAVRRLIVVTLQSLTTDLDSFAKILMPEINNLLAKKHFIEVIGNIPNVGQGFISQETEDELIKILRDDFVNLGNQDLLQIGSPIEILTADAETSWNLSFPNISVFDEKVVESIFRDSISYGYQQAMGANFGESIKQLNWGALRHIYSSDEKIREAFESVQCMDDEWIEISKLVSEGYQPNLFERHSG